MMMVIMMMIIMMLITMITMMIIMMMMIMMMFTEIDYNIWVMKNYGPNTRKMQTIQKGINKENNLTNTEKYIYNTAI
jgi:hypothetical protein